MARDGSGNHSLPEAAFVSGTTIESAKVNANFSDISSALTASLAKDGQTVPTANLPMGGFKHTNVAVATSRTDYARASQIADNSMGYAASSGTDTITATPAPGISAYAIGQRFTLKKDANANTGAVTLNINSIGAGAVTWPDGTALAAGDLPANSAFEVVVQATTPVFHLQTAPKPSLAKTGGTLTGTVAMSGAAINEAKGSDIASATTTDIGAATGNYADVTGTTTITGLGTVQAGTQRIVNFTGALTLTHNATSLILPGGANITTAAGDTAIFVSLGSGNWRCVAYQKASAAPVTLSPIINSLGADVALNNTGSYFTGPSIAQGTSGVWFASGQVTVTSGDIANINAKLWDGTTVIDSGRATIAGTNQAVCIHLSGYLSAPAGNIRISVNDATRTDGSIKFNFSGNSKDSTLSAIRIA